MISLLGFDFWLGDGVAIFGDGGDIDFDCSDDGSLRLW